MTKETKNKLDKWIGEWYEWLKREIKRNIAKGIMAEYAEDLLHHLILDLYKLSDEKVEQMIKDDKLRWFTLRAAGMQLRSSTSPFYLIHRKQKMSSREHGIGTSDKNIFDGVYEPYEDDLYECFQREMDNLHFYQKALMDKYWIQGWTLAQVYKHYNISKIHIVNDLNAAMNIIKTKCNHC
jgi:hypothetical protein